jgi:hypothetical protein
VRRARGCMGEEEKNWSPEGGTPLPFLVSGCDGGAFDGNALWLSLRKDVLPVDDQLRPEHRRSHGDPDDRVKLTFARRLNDSNHNASEDEDQSPGIGAHHPFAMTGDVTVAHEFDRDERAEKPHPSVNP